MATLHLAKEIFNLIYPVGSVYMSFNSINPSTLFGGTWEQIKGRVLVGLNSDDKDFKTSGQTGGSKYLQSHKHNGYTGIGKANNMMRNVHVAGGRVTYNHTVGYESGAYTDCGHGKSDFSGASHYHDFETSTEGQGNSGNLQPYMVCYMWKRTK